MRSKKSKQHTKKGKTSFHDNRELATGKSLHSPGPRERECRQNVRKCPNFCPEGLRTQFSDFFLLQFLPVWSMLMFGDPLQRSPVTTQESAGPTQATPTAARPQRLARCGRRWGCRASPHSCASSQNSLCKQPSGPGHLCGGMHGDTDKTKLQREWRA